MPKFLTVKMIVPSGSRPSAMLDWLNRQLAPHNMTVTTVVDDAELDRATEGGDGFFWFKSERASWPSVCQRVKGQWYAVNEVGPITLEELNRRGWQLDGPVN